MLLITPIHLRLTRIHDAYTGKRNSYESLVNIFCVSDRRNNKDQSSFNGARCVAAKYWYLFVI
jgi:hypothetical protein